LQRFFCGVGRAILGTAFAVVTSAGISAIHAFYRCSCYVSGQRSILFALAADVQRRWFVRHGVVWFTGLKFVCWFDALFMACWAVLGGGRTVDVGIDGGWRRADGGVSGLTGGRRCRSRLRNFYLHCCTFPYRHSIRAAATAIGRQRMAQDVVSGRCWHFSVSCTLPLRCLFTFAAATFITGLPVLFAVRAHHAFFAAADAGVRCLCLQHFAFFP